MPAMIKESCPWFFEMRELIAERPNIVPAGLGNSESGIDMDVLVGGNKSNSEGYESTPSANHGGSSPRWDIEDDSTGAGEDGGVRGQDSETNEGDDSNASRNPESGPSNNEAKKSTGKTAARPGSSKPATRTPKENKKKRKMDEFVEIAGAEEVTRQKELDLARARAEEKKAKMEAKTAEMTYKTQKLAEKSARRKEKAEEKATKLRLLEIRQRTGTAAGITNPSQSGYSHSLAPTFPTSPFTPGSSSPYPLNTPQFRINSTSQLNSSSSFPANSYYRAASESVNFSDANQSTDQPRPTSSFSYDTSDPSREGSLSYSGGDDNMQSESSPFGGGSILPPFDSFQSGQ